MDVSVVIAAWNAGATLRPAVASALAQAGVTLEILVVDDASTDETPRVMSELAGPAIRYLRLPVNSGPAAARNLGFEHAVGRWIAVLDADDRMEPGRLSRLLGAAESSGADLIADNLLVENAAGRSGLFIPEPLDEGLETITLATFAERNRLFDPAPGYGYLKPLFRRAFLERHGLRYDVRLKIGEDYQLVADALAHGARYARSRSAGYVYVKHSNSISHRLAAADLRQLIAADQRFLDRWRDTLDGGAVRALRRRRQSLQRGLAFTDMVDQIKGRRWRAFARTMLHNPAAATLFSMPLRARLAAVTGGRGR